MPKHLAKKTNIPPGSGEKNRHLLWVVIKYNFSKICLPPQKNYKQFLLSYTLGLDVTPTG